MGGRVSTARRVGHGGNTSGQRALRGGAGPVTRQRGEIGERRDQRSLIVLQPSERAIALPAEQAADHAGHVAMIDAQPSLRSPPADRARAALFGEQRLVFRR
jgi:hypothetical protein